LRSWNANFAAHIHVACSVLQSNRRSLLDLDCGSDTSYRGGEEPLRNSVDAKFFLLRSTRKIWASRRLRFLLVKNLC